MEKKTIIDKINLKLKESNENFILSESDMDKLVINISRVMDSAYTNYINSIKDKFAIKINSIQKERFRKYLIGYPIDLGDDVVYFETIPNFTEEIFSLENIAEIISKKYLIHF